MINGSFGSRKRFFKLATNFLLVLLLNICQVALLPDYAFGQEHNSQQQGGCATQYIWEQVKGQIEPYNHNKSTACPIYGICDIPEVRE